MVDYKEFKLEQVLNWQPQIEIDPLRLKDLSVDNEPKYPFYGQATIDNGIIGYYHLNSSVLNNKKSLPTILIHSNNQNIVYLDTPFYLKDGHGATSVLQSDFLNVKSAMYIMTAIRKAIKTRFTYNAKATKIALKNTKIVLPVDDDGKIDYDYMEKYVYSLERDGLEELSVYFKANELEDSELTLEEQSAIDKFNNNQIEFKSFELSTLFCINSSKKKYNANKLKFNGKYPYVVRTSTNNGIKGYINENHQYLNDAQTISFGQDTATVFYQSNPYFTGDKIKIFKYRKKELNSSLGKYLVTSLRKSFNSFSWGSSSFDEKALKSVLISLPITQEGNIDYSFIETYMKAIEKLVLKDVIDWKERVCKTNCICSDKA